VGGADELLRVVDVAVGGGDVEVAAQGEALRRLGGRLQPAAHPRQPLQLPGVVLTVDRPAVGDVEARHPDTGAGGRHQAGLRRTLLGALPEAGHHVVDPDPGGDGHAVPAALAVEGNLVTESVERHDREGLVGQLGLLHAQHVGPGVLHPLLDVGQTGLERVDVPSSDPHELERYPSPPWDRSREFVSSRSPGSARDRSPA
jgi:hypothetical protein